MTKTCAPCMKTIIYISVSYSFVIVSVITGFYISENINITLLLVNFLPFKKNGSDAISVWNVLMNILFSPLSNLY